MPGFYGGNPGPRQPSQPTQGVYPGGGGMRQPAQQTRDPQYADGGYGRQLGGNPVPFNPSPPPPGSVQLSPPRFAPVGMGRGRDGGGAQPAMPPDLGGHQQRMAQMIALAQQRKQAALARPAGARSYRDFVLHHRLLG
jgi:hypothetical protein